LFCRGEKDGGGGNIENFNHLSINGDGATQEQGERKRKIYCESFFCFAFFTET